MEFDDYCLKFRTTNKLCLSYNITLNHFLFLIFMNHHEHLRIDELDIQIFNNLVNSFYKY